MKLGMYMIKRLLLLLPTLLIVSAFTFLLTHVIPANPAIHMAGPAAPPEVVETLSRAMGLDKPIPEQYMIYLKQLSRGDWGFAWHTGNAVSYDLSIRFTATLELALVSLLFALVLGIPLGLLAALNANKLPDHIVRIASLTGLSIPEYVMGLLLIYLFYYKIPIFPPQLGRIGMMVSPPQQITGLYILDSLLTRNWEALRSSASYILLPAFTLGIVLMAPISRFTRSAMLDVLNSEFVLAARSYGLSRRTVNLRYALKNAMFRVTTILGVSFGYLLGGVVLVENIFAWPGLGQYSLHAIRFSDYAAVQGFILVATLSYVLINLGVDILLAVLDPRVRC